MTDSIEFHSSRRWVAVTHFEMEEDVQHRIMYFSSWETRRQRKAYIEKWEVRISARILTLHPAACSLT